MKLDAGRAEAAGGQVRRNPELAVQAGIVALWGTIALNGSVHVGRSWARWFHPHPTECSANCLSPPAGAHLLRAQREQQCAAVPADDLQQVASGEAPTRRVA